MLLAPGERLDPRTAAGALAGVLGTTVLDAAISIRYSSGWVARSVTREVAEAVLAFLAASGVTGFLVADDVPVAPTVRRVRSAVLRDDRLEVVSWEACDGLPLSELACVDLVILGKVGASPEVREQWRSKLKRKGADDQDPIRTSRSDWNQLRVVAEATSHPFRLALRDLELERPEPRLHLIMRSPVECLTIDLLTQFPAEGVLAGAQPCESWFHFVEALLLALPVGKVLPEAALAWSKRDPSAITTHRREALDHRLSWIDQLVRRGLWEEFR